MSEIALIYLEDVPIFGHIRESRHAATPILEVSF
jgi:hypothetical protein